MTTYSVRLGGLSHEQWLQMDGTWGAFKTRARFRDEDLAIACLIVTHGSYFHNFGTFPNSLKGR
jgi:hypothetical protein